MQVRWSDNAVADLQSIVEHIELDSFEAAQGLARRIYDKISSMAEFPRIGRIGKDRRTRELVIPSLPT